MNPHAPPNGYYASPPHPGSVPRVLIQPSPHAAQWNQFHPQGYSPQVFDQSFDPRQFGQYPQPPSIPSQPVQYNHAPPPQALPQHSSASAPQLDSHSLVKLLLSLSEQYVSAARQLGVSMAYKYVAADRQEYNRLVAMGLACLESVCNQQALTLPPRQEANIRLRLAALLYEETCDSERLDNLLTQTASFCETNRLIDLKYACQHLLVRSFFQTNRRASMKLLDKVLHEAETSQHVPWVYAFRFLKVSLSLRLSISREHAVVLILRSIADLARSRGDSAVFYTAAIFEAFVHLHAHTGDSVTEAQRALASARSQQANLGLQALPQLQVLQHLTDIACYLDPYEPKLAQDRLPAMQRLIDTTLKDAPWQSDRTFVVPFNVGDHEKLVIDTCGVFGRTENGGYGIAFSWLSRNTVYALGFLLSSAALFSTSTAEGNRTETSLNQGLKLTEDENAMQAASSTAPLTFSQSAASETRELRCYFLIQLAHAACNRSEWNLAQRQLDRFEQCSAGVALPCQDMLTTAAAYLRGAISQGTGNPSQALYYYQDPVLALDSRDVTTLTYQKIFAILSILNSLLIIRVPEHPSHHLIPAYLDQLRPYFPPPTSSSDASRSTSSRTVATQNPHLLSAHSFLLAALPQNLPQVQQQQQQSGLYTANQNAILPTKSSLQASMNAAKRVGNSLMVTLCLNYMNHSFYQGIVGEQALKAAVIGKRTADQAGMKLWREVSDGILRDTQLREAGQAPDNIHSLFPQ